jgi:sialic acid synthase SpsE
VEELARAHARRGLYAARAIQRGEAFTASNVAILRPPARLGPDAYADLLSLRADRDFAQGDAL